MFSRILLLFTIIAVIKCERMDLALTHLSDTLYGVPCLNDCINGKCYTDYDSVINNILTSCTAREEIAPTYYTTQMQDKPTCLSRCGKYDKDYEWCFVSNDLSWNNWNYWDYCNSEISLNWVEKQYSSLYYGPCADACETDVKNRTLCTNFHKKRVECDKSHTDDFLQAKNIYGEKCLTRCKQHSGKKHNNYYCKDIYDISRMCAPSAKPPPMYDYYKKLPSCVNGSHKGKRCIKKRYSSDVIETANKIEKSKYFKTERVNEARNPVYSYTIKPPMTAGDPILPLVIRAKITADTLKPVGQFKSRSKVSKEETGKIKLFPRDKSFQSNDTESNDVIENYKRMAKLPKDKPRKLIGHYLGGLNKVYNVVPLRRSVRNTTQRFDEEIYVWLKKRNTSVDVTIVVIYGNYSRPDALAVDIVFKKGDKIVPKHRDIILKNIGQGQELNIIEPVKITTTVRPEEEDYEFEIDVLQGLA